jgi:hypothetical protein
MPTPLSEGAPNPGSEQESSKANAERAAKLKYDGRLLPEDINIVPSDNGKDHLLKIRIWTVHSEWKRHSLAEEARDKILSGQDEATLPENNDGHIVTPEQLEVVTLNSRRQHELTGYGKLKLPASKLNPVPAALAGPAHE